MKKKLIFFSVMSLLFSFTKKDFFNSFPAYFPAPVYNFDVHPLDTFKIELGRMLFYDPILSKDSSISCSSCHSSYNAFAHTDHDLSHGIYDRIGNRNAPALFNLAWHSQFMWDGAIHHLDVQALAPINHVNEMGEQTANVVSKLNNSNRYKKMFLKAFNDSIITGEHMLKALSQFQLTLISCNSKYDKVREKKASFNIQEQKGYEVFKKNCNSCHTEPLFMSNIFKNNGLPLDSSLNDFGRGSITKISRDSLSFKTPSLRNLSYTYPYMHDGRFKTLYQVLNHYQHISINSDLLTDKNLLKIQLSDIEKTDLIAFLKTLNDSSFVFNPKFQFPSAWINK